jgi:hypothetical protein
VQQVKLRRVARIVHARRRACLQVEQDRLLGAQQVLGEHLVPRTAPPTA